MFKFTDINGDQVWLRPSMIESVKHTKVDNSHTIVVDMNVNSFTYQPDSEEDCRKFLFELFKAMGVEYKYE